jgi:hypothetical protein
MFWEKNFIISKKNNRTLDKTLTLNPIQLGWCIPIGQRYQRTHTPLLCKFAESCDFIVSNGGFNF